MKWTGPTKKRNKSNNFKRKMTTTTTNKHGNVIERIYISLCAAKMKHFFEVSRFEFPEAYIDREWW